MIASVDRRGGGPIQGVFASSAVWATHGHIGNIASLDPADAVCVQQAPVPTIGLGWRPAQHPFLQRVFPWLRYGYAPNLKSWLTTNAGDYDAIIVNGLWNYISYGSWRALRRLNTPYFVFTHGMLDPWFNRAYPIKHLFKSLFWRAFEHKVLRDAKGVFFTCEEERQLARRAFSPYQAHEYVVGFGTQDVVGDAKLQLQAFRAALPIPPDRKLILFLSRIHEKKGIDLLIRAFASHASSFADYDLVVAGPDQGGLQARLMGLAQELGVADRIHWPGMLTGDVKWGAYRAAEFFVLPSHQENFGVVITEAMALERPVLITNKVNIWREIEADGAGIVVDDTVDALATGLQQLCALPTSARHAMGQRGRACFLARYDFEKNALDLATLMQRLTAENLPKEAGARVQ